MAVLGMSGVLCEQSFKSSSGRPDRAAEIGDSRSTRSDPVHGDSPLPTLRGGTSSSSIPYAPLLGTRAVQLVQGLEGVRRLRIDMCAFGLQVDERGPNKKPTGLLSNHPR
eukprot:1120019-Pyramimonas_sp.AAC.1